MKHYSRNFDNVCVVLRAAKQELEKTTNYVQKIIALNNIAQILKMLTDYQNLGEEIEDSLSIPDNVNSRDISAYAARIQILLTEQIHVMELAKFRH